MPAKVDERLLAVRKYDALIDVGMSLTLLALGPSTLSFRDCSHKSQFPNQDIHLHSRLRMFEISSKSAIAILALDIRVRNLLRSLLLLHVRCSSNVPCKGIPFFSESFPTNSDARISRSLFAPFV